LPHVLCFLDGHGEDRQAVYLETLGTGQKSVTMTLREAIGRDEYFSQVLIRRRKFGAAFARMRDSQQPARILANAATLDVGSNTDLSGVFAKIWVVGLGPGDPELLTRKALDVLHQAEVIVGYNAYLAWLAPLNLKAELRGSPIGKERERALQALQLARSGKRVALVSSGDAGVYGMASVLLETAEHRGLTPAARVNTDTPAAQMEIEAPPARLDIEIIPGVTAATAAAALLGAPLGHDFVCVSLSDLLTPWEVIERHLLAAAQGDLVLALYNPASRERTWQLPRGREILLQHRRPETPVGLVNRAYRSGTRVVQTTLAELTTDGIGMETIVIVGNSQTRVIDERMVTPRGYAASAWVARPESSKGVECLQSVHALRKASGRATHCDLAREIMAESFAIIERELGPHGFPPWVLAVVRRMIHASADFDFAKTLRYSADFEDAIQAAFHPAELTGRSAGPTTGKSASLTIITDTEMVLAGIRTSLATNDALTLTCLINEPGTLALAQSSGMTRSAAGIRLAADRFEHPALVIGNAPTALIEALRLVAGGWRPRTIIGMPVGFVGVEEAKQRLLDQSTVPYLTCTGRKGGSAVAAAAVNALAEWFKS